MPFHPVTTWLVNHCADVINKFKVGSDGKTSYERVKGKPYRRDMVEFGERVYFRSGKLDRQRKMEPRWHEGVFIGMCRRTGGAFIGKGSEVIVAHAIRRVPEEDRWNTQMLKDLKGTPWNMKPNEEETNSPGTAITMRPEDIIPQVNPEPEEAPIPLRVRLKPPDFEVYGYTSGCQGCKAILRR